MMQKQKRKEAQADQSVRFRAEVERMIADGELSPIAAEAMLNDLLSVEKPKEQD
jgi:hypothetical protein